MRLLALILCTTSLAFGDELLRPTTDANSGSTAYGCSGTNIASQSFANAHDAAGLATSSSGQASGGPCQKILNGQCVVQGHNQFLARTFTGWPASGNTWAGLTINVNWSSGGGSLPLDKICIAYSVNSGSGWISLVCSSAGQSQGTTSAALNPGQDLTKLQVGICIMAQGTSDAGQGFDDLRVWDIWTLGTNNVPPPTPSPSPAGRPNDPIIISRWWQELLEAV